MIRRVLILFQVIVLLEPGTLLAARISVPSVAKPSRIAMPLDLNTSNLSFDLNQRLDLEIASSLESIPLFKPENVLSLVPALAANRELIELVDPKTSETKARENLELLFEGSVKPGELLDTYGRQPLLQPARVSHMIRTLRKNSRAYRAAHAARRQAGFDPVVIRPKVFLADLFGIGQVAMTKTMLGFRIDRNRIEQTARAVFHKHFAQAEPGSVEAFDKFLARVKRIFPTSTNRVRKEIQDALIEASLVRPGRIAQLFDKRFDSNRIRQVEHFRRISMPLINQGLERELRLALQETRDSHLGPDDFNVVGVLVTGSFAYGEAISESDLDLKILTRDGTSRGARFFIERLEPRFKKFGWPSVVDLKAHWPILEARSAKTRLMGQQFESFVIALDLELEAELNGTAPIHRFDSINRLQRFLDRLLRPFVSLLARISISSFNLPLQIDRNSIQEDLATLLKRELNLEVAEISEQWFQGTAEVLREIPGIGLERALTQVLSKLLGLRHIVEADVQRLLELGIIKLAIDPAFQQSRRVHNKSLIQSHPLHHNQKRPRGGFFDDLGNEIGPPPSSRSVDVEKVLGKDWKDRVTSDMGDRILQMQRESGDVISSQRHGSKMVDEHGRPLFQSSDRLRSIKERN